MNLTLAAVAGQVGCLTLVIILAAVFGGLWLDARFDSKPLYTLSFLIASIPVSLGVMFLVVRAAIRRMKITPTAQSKAGIQEDRIGNNS